MKLMNINFLRVMRVIQIKNQINIFYLKNIPELFKDRFIYDSLDTNKILNKSLPFKRKNHLINKMVK